MVSEGDEMARFQHVAEMLYGLIDGQQLAVGCTVFLLSQVEFLGEEGEGLLGVLGVLLQHGTHSRHGGICDECKWRAWIRVRQ
jgi:hypothetical protein